MDYVVGSVAALISGNVTPNRPKLVRRALTPTKHQLSPNVTPKSELVDDRSIFLSPSVQKKKAIVKKSPKRIFQNPDLDTTGDTEKNLSPKADKVKKHLKEDLESNDHLNKSAIMLKSTKVKKIKSEAGLIEEIESPQNVNENTPKKKKKRKSTAIEDINNVDEGQDAILKNEEIKNMDEYSTNIVQNDQTNENKYKKKKNKLKKSNENKDENCETVNELPENIQSSKKRNKKDKKKHTTDDIMKSDIQESPIHVEAERTHTVKKKSKKNKDTYVNPNAITTKDTDSEHESDDEIHSENEEANKEILDTGPVDESSDEDTPKQKKTDDKEKIVEVRTEEEIKRTIFVGNVLFSKKCKKEVKKIFNKYGTIETVRIRTVPVKDARVTPKLAIIKSELHPERTTVNVYVKFKDPASVEQALSENNTVLNGCHLRVTRSQSTGAEHDPHCAVFVGNVPFALEDETLREKFEKCGEIASVRIIRDKKTNAGKGFAYVNFASKDGVELALALSEEDLTIKNRILRVKRCTQNTQRSKNQDPARNNNKQNLQGSRSNQKHQFERKSFKPRGQHHEGASGIPEGVQRRLMNKRKNQDGGDGPSEKRQNLYQPQKEKKARKEFVGLTAEKKKKHTFNKGQKKKRALSEILTKFS